jgi:hypothetical protein
MALWLNSTSKSSKHPFSIKETKDASQDCRLNCLQAPRGQRGACANILGHWSIPALQGDRGFSNGGHTAMKLAIRDPERVHRLILASAFYKRDGVDKRFRGAIDKAEFHRYQDDPDQTRV